MNVRGRSTILRAPGVPKNYLIGRSDIVYFVKKFIKILKVKLFITFFKKKIINKKCFFILTKIFNETNTIKYLKYFSENTNYSKRNETNEIGCVRGRLKIQPKK